MFLNPSLTFYFKIFNSPKAGIGALISSCIRHTLKVKAAITCVRQIDGRLSVKKSHNKEIVVSITCTRLLSVIRCPFRFAF